MPGISLLCEEGLGVFTGECCNYFCFLDGTPWIPGDKWLVRAGAGVWEEAAAATGHGNIGKPSTGTLARPGEPIVRFKRKAAQRFTGAGRELGAAAQ